MTISESFYSFVSGNSTITDELASTNSIWPQHLPQSHDGYPALTYNLEGEDDIPLIDGGRSATRRARIEVRVWDESFKSVNDVADVIKSELIGHTGAFGSHTAIYIRKDEGGEIALPPEPDTKLRSVRLVFEVNYR